MGNVICSSGIAGKDPATGVLPADAAEQARNAFTNLAALLAVGGASMNDVVKLAVTLNDDAARDAVNAEWLAAFPNPDDRPARHITLAPLQHGMLVQLEVLAVVQAV